MVTFRVPVAGARSGEPESQPESASLAVRVLLSLEAAALGKAGISAAPRQRHLTTLARDIDGAWATLEKVVEASRYDEAVKLAVDLRDLASRDGTTADFAKRFEALRKRQLRRRGFFDRWKRANESE